jgi:hypothetical protein
LHYLFAHNYQKGELKMVRQVKSLENKKFTNSGPKKTSIGNGTFSKFGHKGGGRKGSTPSGNYRKKSRGQGR